MTYDTQPAAQTIADANQFDILGPIHISYSSSSITGQPLLSYQDAELDLNFQGADITRASGSAGEQVTVTLQHVPDAFIRTITLVVPAIRLAAGEQVDFATFAFETVDRSSAHVLPPGPTGVLQTYHIHQLRGTAAHVDS
jgi:hypothetical protein